MTLQSPRQISLSVSHRRRLGRLWGALRRVAPGPKAARAVVLTYHEVGAWPWGVPAPLFETQMGFLRRHASVLSLDELLAGNGRENGARFRCAITFDDGYAGVFERALPILVRHGFPATVYLTTDAISAGDSRRSEEFPGLDPGQRLLTWAQVRELAPLVTAGSHLCQHLDMSKLDRQRAAAELLNSKRTIEDRLGKSCDHFAFPWGRFSLRSLEWVRAAGYRTAVTVVHRPVTAGFDPFRIPRLQVDGQCAIGDFAAIVRGDWDYLGLMQMFRRPLLRSGLLRRANGGPTGEAAGKCGVRR